MSVSLSLLHFHAVYFLHEESSSIHCDCVTNDASAAAAKVTQTTEAVASGNIPNEEEKIIDGCGRSRVASLVAAVLKGRGRKKRGSFQNERTSEF